MTLQILTRCAILWSIQQNYLKQMINLERISKKYLIGCLIQDKVDELMSGEELFQNLEYEIASCLIRFETDDTEIKVFLKGDFNDFRIFVRDKETESDIE